MLWDKGVGELVEAARLLQGEKQARFALAGEPDPGNPASIKESTLRGWQEEGIIEWWGWQPDMKSVYTQSHIVTLPTYGEGVPTTLLEAAACGRPIVASNVPGCQAVVREGLNGLLVPPGDPEALADALGRLISDAGLRGRMGAAGRQLVLEKFTTTKVNSQTLDVYRKLLEADPSPGNKA
jgi:glycosyltransferase involved in cell wall biosynthesis